MDSSEEEDLRGGRASREKKKDSWKFYYYYGVGQTPSWVKKKNLEIKLTPENA